MHVEPPRPSRWILCRNAFLSGVLLLAPLVVTVWAFRKVVDLVGGSFRPFYEDLIPRAPASSGPFSYPLPRTRPAGSS